MGDGQNVLDPRAISDGTLDALGTTVLVTPSAYLVTPAVAGPGSTPSRTGRRRLAPSQTASWSLGTPLDVTSLTIPVRGPGGAGPGIRVGLVAESGSTQWVVPVEHAGAGIEVSTTPARAIVAVRVVAGPRRIDLGPPMVRTVQGQSYRADGQLQDALVAPRWRFGGFDGSFAVFDDTLARPALSLQALPHGASEGASIRVTGGPAFAPTRAEVSSPRGITVVRAGAAIPGWSASWHPSGSATTQVLAVRRSGVVQAVDVPPGRGTLTWRYLAPGIRVALWLALGALAVVAGLVAVAWVGGRRARRRPGPPERAPGAVTQLRSAESADDYSMSTSM